MVWSFDGWICFVNYFGFFNRVIYFFSTTFLGGCAVVFFWALPWYFLLCCPTNFVFPVGHKQWVAKLCCGFFIS